MATKKTNSKEPEEAAKITDSTVKDARAAVAAAKRLFGKREDYKIGNLLAGDFEKTKSEVNDMDQEFKNEAEHNDIDVRVMQVGPNGQLTDVSDKVNVASLRPEQIADFRMDGSSIPMGPDGKIDRQAALDLLAQIMGKMPREGRNLSEEVMKRMEITLAESDKLLKHFKE